MELKNVFANFDPLSIYRYAGMPNGSIQRSRKKFAILRRCCSGRREGACHYQIPACSYEDISISFRWLW